MKKIQIRRDTLQVFNRYLQETETMSLEVRLPVQPDQNWNKTAAMNV